MSAAEEDDALVETLQAEVAALSSQNQQLIAMLKTQLAQFEQQQTVVENLAKRVAELESSKAPTQDTAATQSPTLSFSDELELSGLADSEVSQFENTGVTFGGWAGFAYTDDNRSSTKPGFDAHPLYMYARAEPADNWTFFGEIEIEHLFKSSGSGTAGELKMERLYIEREFDDASRVRAGKFFLPYGYWYNLHWHFLTETLSRPISFNNSYVPKQQVGIEYINTSNLGNVHLNYYAWLGNGPDLFGTDKRTENDFSIGGAVFAETTFENGVSIGGTFGLHQQTVALDKQTNAVIGAKFSAGPLELRSEYYQHRRQLSEDLESVYVSTQFNTSDTFGIVYRVDYGDDVKISKDSSNPTTTSSSFGFIWRPLPQLLFKGEYRVNHFDSPFATADYDNWNFFSAIKF